MFGRFIPPEPDKGDVNTVGGYAAVHGRPAAFEGKDGLSYSVEIESDASGDRSQPFAAYLLFLRWSETAEPVVTGHLETPFLSYGASADEARAVLGRTSLREATALLNALIDEPGSAERARPWWEVMQNEEGD